METLDFPGIATGNIRVATVVDRVRQHELDVRMPDGDVIRARMLTGLDPAPGDEVVVAFDDRERPIVMGILAGPNTKRPERLVLEADREIVLKCGKASITLTRAGKLLMRGAYLLSRSSGANRIKGASVQVN